MPDLIAIGDDDTTTAVRRSCTASRSRPEPG
jgi:hypothetical protein